MKELIDKTLLKESIEFNGSILNLREQIRFKKERKFRLEWISDKEFKVTSNLSLGTIILDSNSNFFDGIKCYAKLTELKNGKTKIEFKTKLRIEFYLFGGIFILALLATFFSGKEIPVLSILIFPVIILWFWFIYRFQEKLLFRKVRKYIEFELKKRSTTSVKRK